MKNAMQLKAVIKNLSKKKHISAQILLQNYMLERFLERVSLSKYKSNFILKGGFLIAAMVGLDTRATMDMDATIKGYPVNEKTIREMFENICDINIPDDISFNFQHLDKIRESDDYIGYRATLTADYQPMIVPLKLDITTGDIITPKEIEFLYPLMFEDRNISVMAYNMETVLAEKLETVISRSDQNTRPRDYYDVYILNKLWFHGIDFSRLKNALKATAKKRGSGEILKDYQKILQIVRESQVMQQRWMNYCKDFSYASEIKFVDVCAAVEAIMKQLIEIKEDDLFFQKL